MRKRTFILSCGRAGSTALATYMRQLQPDTTVVHEPVFWTFLRLMSTRIATGKSTEDNAALLIRSMRLSELAREKGAYLETTPALWGFTAVLPRVFPDCNLIHIVRNPNHYAQSAIQFRSFSHIKGFLVDTIPDMTPKPESMQEDAMWSRMHPSERSIWFWYVVNHFIDQQARVNDLAIRRFRFEDLFGPEMDEREAVDLANLLDISNPDFFLECLRNSPVNKSRKSHQDESSMNDEIARNAIDRWAKQLMSVYGYANY